MYYRLFLCNLPCANFKFCMVRSISLVFYDFWIFLTSKGLTYSDYKKKFLIYFFNGFIVWSLFWYKEQSSSPDTLFSSYWIIFICFPLMWGGKITLTLWQLLRLYFFNDLFLLRGQISKYTLYLILQCYDLVFLLMEERKEEDCGW